MCYSIVHRYPKHSNHETERFHLPCREMLSHKLSTDGLSTLPPSCPPSFVEHLESFIKAAEIIERDLKSIGNDWLNVREALLDIAEDNVRPALGDDISHLLNTPCDSPAFFSPGAWDDQSTKASCGSCSSEDGLIQDARIQYKGEKPSDDLYKRLQGSSGKGLTLRRVNKQKVPAPIQLPNPSNAFIADDHLHPRDAQGFRGGHRGRESVTHGALMHPCHAIVSAPRTSDI